MVGYSDRNLIQLCWFQSNLCPELGSVDSRHMMITWISSTTSGEQKVTSRLVLRYYTMPTYAQRCDSKGIAELYPCRDNRSWSECVITDCGVNA
ncbi:hypothetical protein DPMN_082141 [Dreissena polymorpha]|uniref:Uncharacterized protein n=1 Tax=Dreissena polymorpha TaxID=45954 RepID=A0A9D3Y748_DREPO|nr:hypothetical protein DPMN_082141 [Dreissena polymorpha]